MHTFGGSGLANVAPTLPSGQSSVGSLQMLWDARCPLSVLRGMVIQSGYLAAAQALGWAITREAGPANGCALGNFPLAHWKKTSSARVAAAQTNQAPHVCANGLVGGI